MSLHLVPQTVRHYRKLKNLGRLDFADAAGCDESTIQRVENPKTYRLTRPDIANNIAQALGVTVEDLMQPFTFDEVVTAEGPFVPISYVYYRLAEKDGAMVRKFAGVNLIDPDPSYQIEVVGENLFSSSPMSKGTKFVEQFEKDGPKQS